MDLEGFPGRARRLLEAGAGAAGDVLGRLGTGRDAAGVAGDLQAALTVVQGHGDCADFRANLLLRAWRLHGGCAAVPAALWARARRALLDLTYRDFPPDNRMTHRSENHRLAFMAAEYLAAESWPDAIFGHTGRPATEHRLQARNDLVDWTNWVGTYGTQEWDSSTYYGIDLAALLNLFDLAADPGVRRRAQWVLDGLVLDIALKTFAGVYGASHGRCYFRPVTSPEGEATVNVLPAFFGLGELRAPGQSHRPLDAYLATTAYRPPAALGAVAESREPMTHRQRNRADDRYYPPPDVPGVKNLNLYHDVNLVTRRTGHGMLSSVQDYRREEESAQVQAWQATLGPGAVVFVNQPGGGAPDGGGGSPGYPGGRRELPGYWIGSARPPRIAQVEGALAALYAPDPGDAFPFTHAYFPEKAFEEAVSGRDWAAARLGAGYLGLRCTSPLGAAADGPWAGVERRAAAGPAGWVCELADRASAGSFEAFVRSLQSTPLALEPGARALTWRSPRCGEIRLPWSGPILVDGRPGAFGHFPRHDGPYAQSAFGSGVTEVHCGEHRARIALDAPAGSAAPPP